MGQLIKEYVENNSEETFWLDIKNDDLIRQYSYNRLSNYKYSSYLYNDKLVRVIVPELLSGSDYSGAHYTKSNCDVFFEEFGDLPGIYLLYGGHGTYSIAIEIECDRDQEKEQEIIDCLDALDDYPIIDEDKCSEYELELQDESWENNDRRDFINAVEKELAIELNEDCDGFDDNIYSLFRELCEETNTYYEMCYQEAQIDIDRVVKPVSFCDLQDNNIEYTKEYGDKTIDEYMVFSDMINEPAFHYDGIEIVSAFIDDVKYIEEHRTDVINFVKSCISNIELYYSISPVYNTNQRYEELKRESEIIAEIYKKLNDSIPE